MRSAIIFAKYRREDDAPYENDDSFVMWNNRPGDKAAFSLPNFVPPIGYPQTNPSNKPWR